MDYKIIDNGEETLITVIDADGVTWYIPADESNSDYQQYLLDTDGGLPLPKSKAK